MSATSPVRDRTPLRALIVEDSAADAGLVVRELERHGYAVDWQRVDGAESLRAVLAERPWDILLSDHALPGFSSFAALEVVHASGLDLPFIIVSGSIGEETAVEAMRAGAHDYLLKGHLARLGPAVARELREAQQRRARRRAEDELARGAASYRALFESMLNGFAYCRMLFDLRGSPQDFVYLEVNSAFESLTGLKDVVGKKVSEVIPGIREADPKLFEIYGRVARTGNPERFEVYLAALKMWFSISVYSPEPEHFVAVFDVITERKRAEESLRASEERLRLALMAANQGLYDLDLRTGEAVVSPEYAIMLGYDPTQFRETNARWIERLHPEDREPVAALYRDYVDGKIPEYRVEFRQRTRDGRWKWILSLGKVVERDAEGHPLRMLGTHTDISEIKQAEAERARLASAIDQVAEAVVITDTEGTIQYVNPAFETVTGYTCEEAIGQTPRILKSGEHDAAFYGSLWKTLSGGGTWTGRFVNQKKDGTRFTDESVISPVRNAAGVIVSYVAVKRDITEQLRQSLEKEQLQAQLLQAQKMESVGRLAGGVAHDFNNMLNVIIGRAEMALRKTTPAEPIRRDLDEILKAAQRSADITRQLLAFARKQTVSPKVLDLSETVAGMLKLLRRLIGEDIELAFLPGPSLWKVKMDPSQVDQLLANLVVNARDAIDGVGRVSIETANAVLDDAYCAGHPGSVPGEHVLLAVSDDGSGMDEETLAHIFEPFFTTKGEGKGTGLGLATVYGVVKQNDGSIDVSSQPGRGSAFRIYLPRTAAQDAAAAPALAADTVRGGTETVLLVEDEGALLAIGKEVLEGLGYTVLASSTPGQALRVAEQHAGVIHLLLTDVVMPEMNGRELTDRLRLLRPGLKCLFMSGYTADVIAHRGVLDEGVRFIQKPFSVKDLAAKVREALEG